jgi:hypothetical protein
MVDLILRRMRAQEAAEGHPLLIDWHDTDYAIVDRDRPAGRQRVGRMRLDQRPAGAMWCWYMQAADVVPAGVRASGGADTLEAAKAEFAAEYGKVIGVSGESS